MRLPAKFASIGAIVAIAAAIGGWIVVTGIASSAAVPGHSSFEAQRPSSPSEPRLLPLW
jgi:hypothetical protein